jgi:hypothetical protein
MEIGPLIERIDGFLQVDTLEVVHFAPESQIREIQGFSVC